MFRKGCWLAFVSAVFLSLLPAKSIADSTTFNVSFFQPSIGRNSYLMLNNSQTIHQLQFDVGEFASYAYRPFEIRQAGQRLQGVVDHLLIGDLTVALGIMDWLQVGLDLPLVFINQFKDPSVAPAPAMENHFDLGDMRFEIKARLVDSNKHAIGLAIIPFITAPTGNDSHYVGDPGPTGGVKVAIDGRIYKNGQLTFNAGYRGGRKVHSSNIEYQNLLLLGAGFDATIVRNFDLFIEFNSLSAFNKLFTAREDNPIEFMGGAKWDAGKTGITLLGGAGSCIICNAKGAEVRAVLAAKYRLNTKKYRELDQEALACVNARFEKAPIVEKIPEGIQMVGAEIRPIKPVYFASGSAKVGPRSSKSIDLVISVINNNAWIKRIRIDSYADSSGTPRANKIMSKQRAESVIRYMREHGLRGDVDVVPIAYGENQPAAPNLTEKGRRQNRRVMFTIAGYEPAVK